MKIPARLRRAMKAARAPAPAPPVEVPEDDGDLQEVQEGETSEIHAAAQERDDAYAAEKESDFYAIVVFRSHAQRDAFLRACQQPEEDLVNGLALARVLQVDLPASPPLKERRVWRKWADLVR